MNSVLNMIKRDLIRSGRDNILLYVILSPIILAVIAYFILPNFTSPSYDLVIDGETASAYDFRQINSNSLTVQKEIDEEILVENGDSIAVRQVNGRYEILVSQENASAAKAYIEEQLIPLLEGGEPVIESRNRAVIIGYTTVLLLLTTMLLGGMTAGMLIVDERAGKTLEGTAVTPTGITEYIFAKSILSFVIPLIIGFFVSLIVAGRTWSPAAYLTASAGALPLGILFGMLTGYFADNQISALGTVKLLMPLFLTIPVVSLFVPGNLKALFYLFPNFWLFESLQFVFIPGYANPVGFALSTVIALLSGLAVLAFILPKCAKRFGLR